MQALSRINISVFKIDSVAIWFQNCGSKSMYQQDGQEKKSACMSAMINLQYALTFLNMHTKVRLNVETSDKYSTF
jgi:hypothetical protein